MVGCQKEEKKEAGGRGKQTLFTVYVVINCLVLQWIVIEARLAYFFSRRMGLSRTKAVSSAFGRGRRGKFVGIFDPTEFLRVHFYFSWYG